MKAVLIAVGAFILTTVFVVSGVRVPTVSGESTGVAPYATSAQALYKVSPASRSASLAESGAMSAVENYANEVFKQHVSVQARYVSVDLHGQSVRSRIGVLTPLGTENCWEIMVSGFTMAPFASDPYAIRNGIVPQPYHYATFIVDGSTGKVLQAKWD